MLVIILSTLLGFYENILLSKMSRFTINTYYLTYTFNLTQ